MNCLDIRIVNGEPQSCQDRIFSCLMSEVSDSRLVEMLREARPCEACADDKGSATAIVLLDREVQS